MSCVCHMTQILTSLVTLSSRVVVIITNTTESTYNCFANFIVIRIPDNSKQIQRKICKMNKLSNSQNSKCTLNDTMKTNNVILFFTQSNKYKHVVFIIYINIIMHTCTFMIQNFN